MMVEDIQIYQILFFKNQENMPELLEYDVSYFQQRGKNP